ncbi:MAG: hypothetical protein PHR68_05020 [Candidatus Gracilibacteria bacterium]|nr:hypothetical protein [Candidatus Gracilibacteria bacterium]
MNNFGNIKDQLLLAGINIELWGIKDSKNINSLEEEISKGECILKIIDGVLMRVVNIIRADIFYNSSDGKTYNLREVKQVFNDGHERIRNLDSSVSEKIKLGEKPFDAVIRGIQEELNIMNIININYCKTEEKIEDSISYPGLKSIYIKHWFTAILTDEQFNSAGYIEKQDDKSTFFSWNEI